MDDKIYQIAKNFNFLIVSVEKEQKVVADKRDFEEFLKFIISEVRNNRI